MTTKEQIVDLLRADFDFWRACELADTIMDEARTSPSRVTRYIAPSCVITLRRNGEQVR